MRVSARSIRSPHVSEFAGDPRAQGAGALPNNTAFSSLPGALRATLLAPFPVLSSSRFCLELMAGGKTLDLRQVADLLGRDPGAVLRIFSAVAQEFPIPNDRPQRLNECIMSLDRQDLIAALHTPASSRGEQVAMMPFARHAALISRFALPVAASLGLDEANAQLVGLLHALDELPAALGRAPLPGNEASRSDLGMAISQRHHLPAEITAALGAIGRKDATSVWVAVIHAAHDLASSAGGLQENEP